jgi:hypothetical protein
MFFTLIKHEWQKKLRAQGFYKNLAVNIMLGFFAIYMAGILLFLGSSLDGILETAHEVLNPMELINGAMLYLVLGGLMLRILMQQLNTINLPTYQVLPVKRSTLINFLLLKPLFNPINYFLLLIIIPFSIQSVANYYSAGVALRFVLVFIMIIWFNSLTASLLKRRFTSSLTGFIGILLVAASIAALEYFKIFSLFDISLSAFNFIVLNPAGLILLLAAVFVAYILNSWFFSQNYYPESFNKFIKSTTTTTSDFTFLNRFGMIGEIIALELKLILRHKRTKSLLYMSAFFLLYGLLLYNNDMYIDKPGMTFFVAMFLTGLLMFMFGQWVISWDSAHFDCLMTKNIPVKTYLNANFYMLLAFNTLCFLLTTPYFLMGKVIIYNHIAAFIFNSGVNVFLLLYFATYNTKRIDLSQASVMNYQGTSFKNFLIVMPMMFVPMLLIGLLSMLFSTEIILLIMSCIGIIGLLLHKKLISACEKQFNQRKYKLAEGFRQKE